MAVVEAFKLWLSSSPRLVLTASRGEDLGPILLKASRDFGIELLDHRVAHSSCGMTVRCTLGDKQGGERVITVVRQTGSPVPGEVDREQG